MNQVNTRPTTLARRLAVGCSALAIAVIPTACGGSALDPATVRAANEGVAGQVNSSSSGNSTGSAEGGIGTTTGGTSGTAGTEGSGSTASTGSTGAGPNRSGNPPAVAKGSSGSCAGFKNSKGITDKTISIGNASDISGPIPGLFTSSQQATKAFVAYFNATSDICGRKLDLDLLDTRTDAGADQQAYQTMCEKNFAAVGSMSGFDSGGAKVAEGCGLPDVRATGVTSERANCGTCFGALSVNVHQFQNAVPDFALKNYRSASQKGAILYLNAGAGAENGKTQAAAVQKRGMKIIYTAGIDVSEFNYGPYVQAMKDKGVRWVQFVGSYQAAARLAQAMQSGGFKPDAYVLDPAAYNPEYVKTAGSAAEGTIVYMNFVPFENAGSNKEMQLYLQWLNQVAPGATPTFFGLYSWSAARLFVQQAAALGGKLTQASLVASLKQVKGWADNGLHAPQPVGTKQSSECWRFLQLKNGKWGPLGGKDYQCRGITTVG